MNKFIEAVEAPQEARTENGMKAFSHTGSALLDLFSKIGSGRGRNLEGEFHRASDADAEMTARILLWARDVLEGAGERETVRKLIKKMEIYNPDLALRLMPKLAELGRADDILFSYVLLEKEALAFYVTQMKAGNKLFFKWAPREKSANKAVAAKLRTALGMAPAEYRKYLSSNTEVVEQQMSAKKWNEINYSHVPSIAAMSYKKAFAKNDAARYAEYLAELSKPVEQRAAGVKINAGAIFPHQIIHSIRNGDVRAADAQWEALPNFIGTANVLPVVDVSGSMNVPIAGSVTALEVSLALGLYFSYKNKGAFKDIFVTFSDNAEFNVLKGTLSQRLAQMSNDNKWNMTTNLHSVFNKILTTALDNKVPVADMPSYVLILSDMEFNGCVKHDDHALKMIKRKYFEAGYDVPNVIFWNLTARNDSTPVKAGDSGTSLVSGFSPAIMKSILECDKDDFEPVKIMMKTIQSDRYNF